MTAIQHHPKRQAGLADLLGKLDGPVVVCQDPEPDKLTTNSFTTYRLCLELAPPGGHLLVLQDDAEPCRNLVAACGVIAQARPDSLVVLWHGERPPDGARAVQQAMERGVRYAPIVARGFVPAVACLWPFALAKKVANSSSNVPWRRTWPQDDAFITRALSVHPRPQILATIPSLVEHPDTDSIRKRRIGHRHAISFIGDADPLELDWS